MESTRWLCVCGLVITALLPVGWQMVMKDLADESRWQSFERESAQSFTSNVKRHSEGTFTSDFTRHLDNMKAKDFVHWLINTKRYSFRKRSVKENPNTLKYLPGPFWFRWSSDHREKSAFQTYTWYMKEYHEDILTHIPRYN